MGEKIINSIPIKLLNVNGGSLGHNRAQIVT